METVSEAHTRSTDTIGNRAFIEGCIEMPRVTTFTWAYEVALEDALDDAFTTQDVMTAAPHAQINDMVLTI